MGRTLEVNWWLAGRQAGQGGGTNQSLGTRSRPACPIGLKGHVNSSDWLWRCGGGTLESLVSTAWALHCLKRAFSLLSNVGNLSWKLFFGSLYFNHFLVNMKVCRESGKYSMRCFQNLIYFPCRGWQITHKRKPLVVFINTLKCLPVSDKSCRFLKSLPLWKFDKNCRVFPNACSGGSVPLWYLICITEQQFPPHLQLFDFWFSFLFRTSSIIHTQFQGVTVNQSGVLIKMNKNSREAQSFAYSLVYIALTWPLVGKLCSCGVLSC